MEHSTAKHPTREVSLSLGDATSYFPLSEPVNVLWNLLRKKLGLPRVAST